MQFKNKTYASFKEFIENEKKLTSEEINVPEYAAGDEEIIYDLLQEKIKENPIWNRENLRKAANEFALMFSDSENITYSKNKSLYEAAYDATQRLGMPVPVLYLYNDNANTKSEYLYNAMALGLKNKVWVYFSKRFIVENMYNQAEKRFIIGHELGHIQCNHIASKFLNIYTLFTGRLHEYSADRAGLIAAADLNASVFALLKLEQAVNHLIDPRAPSWKSIKPEDVEAIIENIEYTVKNLENDSSTHPSIYRRIAALKLFRQSELFYKFTGIKDSDNLLSRKQLDENMKWIIS